MDHAENILYESNWSLKAQKLLSFVLNFNLYKYFDTKTKVNTKKVFLRKTDISTPLKLKRLEDLRRLSASI